MAEFAVFSFCPDCNEFKVLPCTCEKKPAPAPAKTPDPAPAKAADPVVTVDPAPVASTVANTASDAPAKTGK